MLEKILLIKDILELIHHFRKAILISLLIGLGILLLLFGWVSGIDKEDKLASDQRWNMIKYGDSVFVKKNVFYLDFYKKGKQKLSDYEQQKINYRRTDTLNFIKQNSVHEKYFYQNRTSFIGVCIGKDSTITQQGNYNKNRWIKIKPSYNISHPPKADKYDYEARKWENKLTGYFVVGKLSKVFYLDYQNVTFIRNDSIFNQ